MTAASTPPLYASEDIEALGRVLAVAALDELISEFETNAALPTKEQRGVLRNIDDDIVPLSE